MQSLKLRIAGGLLFWAIVMRVAGAVEIGPLAHEFRMTLEPGSELEVMGPLYGQKHSGSLRSFRISPFFSMARDEELGWREIDFLYPIFSHDRSGGEYRDQMLLITA